MSYTEELASLSRLEVFQHLDKAELKRLVLSSERYEINMGEYLFRQGDESETVFFVIEGELSVCLESTDPPQEIAVRGTGELVGDIAAITGEKRSASLRAKSATEVIGIDGPLFVRTVTEHPQTSLAVMKILSRRLTALSAQPVPAR